MSGRNDLYVEANSDDESVPAAAVGAEVDMSELEHVPRSLFKKIQHKILDIEMTGTPNKLGGTTFTWRMAPHLARELKQNLAKVSRNMAGDEHLAGDLRKCIPLAMTVIQHTNSFPYAVGIKIKGMMDTNMHANGTCVWRVPANTRAMPVSVNVFEPATPINQYMYEKQRLCSLEDLAEDVRYVPASTKRGKDPLPEHYMVKVDSFAYDYMADELERGVWEDQYDIAHFDVDHVLNPGRNRMVMVTKQIGDDIIGAIKPQIVEASAGFINLDDMNVEIVRADGHEHFATPKGIAGMIIGDGITEPRKVQSDLMNTVCTYSVKVDFAYILQGN
jgi:hypothetical protein